MRRKKTRWEEKIYPREVSLYIHNYTKYFTVGLPWQWKICLHCRRPRFNPWVRKIPWRREWQPTPVVLPGESHGQEPGGLPAMGSQRVGHDWATNTFTSLFFFHFTLLIPLIFFCLTLGDPMDCTCQAPPSMGFSRQDYWSGLPFPSLGDSPNPGIEPGSPVLQTDSLPSEPQGGS